MMKVTKLEKLGAIWAEWNAREITGDQAMARIHILFPKVTLKMWNESIRQKELKE